MLVEVSTQCSILYILIIITICQAQSSIQTPVINTSANGLVYLLLVVAFSVIWGLPFVICIYRNYNNHVKHHAMKKMLQIKEQLVNIKAMENVKKFTKFAKERRLTMSTANISKYILPFGGSRSSTIVPIDTDLTIDPVMYDQYQTGTYGTGTGDGDGDGIYTINPVDNMGGGGYDTGYESNENNNNAYGGGNNGNYYVNNNYGGNNSYSDKSFPA